MSAESSIFIIMEFPVSPSSWVSGSIVVAARISQLTSRCNSNRVPIPLRRRK